MRRSMQVTQHTVSGRLAEFVQVPVPGSPAISGVPDTEIGLFSQDTDATASCGGRACLRQPGGQQSSCTDTIGSMPANSAPVCRKHQVDGTGNRVGGNYNGFREHYKQLGSPLVFQSSTRTKLRPRDSS
jgi:hypothetical protein